MKKKAKDKNRQIFISSRRGVIIVALIAILVLMINLISASYSWFTPQEDTKHRMEYAFDGNIRSESCTMSTFLGTKETTADISHNKFVDQITYASTVSTGSVTVPKATTVNGKTVPGISYFKTEIVNADTKYASDISLFIKSLPVCTLAVTYPGNSVRTFASGATDCYIVRDAYVKKFVSTDVNGPGKLVIEWFVSNSNTTSTVSVDLDELYLVYN